MALEYHNTPLPPENASSKGEKNFLCGYRLQNYFSRLVPAI